MGSFCEFPKKDEQLEENKSLGHSVARKKDSTSA
jgi:hypothetical protein